MGFYENAYRLRDGAVLLYTRPGRKKTTYQARLKIPGVGGYVIKSLKTADLNAAISEAEDLYYELRAAEKQGLDVHVAGNLRFKDLWKRFYDSHQAGLSIHRQRLHTSFAKNYFIPFLGEHRVADMPDAFVEKYWDWRINFYNPVRREAEGRDDPIPPNAARIPAQKTLDMEAGMLRQIFRWGKRVGCVKREPWIKAPKVNHTMGVVRRPTFSETEWKRVYEYLRDWVKARQVTSAGKNGGKCVYYRCHTPSCGVCIRERAIDDLLSRTYSTIRLDQEEMRDLRDMVEDMKKSSTDDLAERSTSFQLQLAGCESRLARLTDALIDGLIGKELFESRKSAVLFRRRELLDRLERIDSDGSKVERALQLLELANTAYLSYQKGYPPEKRALIAATMSNFLGSGKTPAITLKSPFKELSEWRTSTCCDQYRDEPRTRARKILDIFVGAVTEEITPVVTEKKHVAPDPANDTRDDLQRSA